MKIRKTLAEALMAVALCAIAAGPIGAREMGLEDCVRQALEMNPDLLDAAEAIDQAATGITQAILPVPEHLKADLLKTLLGRGEIETALVFTRTKHRANRLWQKLSKAGVPCERIHGNRSQPQREKALAAFKHGRIRVLVATDIAARGIDVEALPHVVNFDVPVQAEDYIHRVGRTARAGRVGEALTFASPAENDMLQSIERAVGRRLERRQVAGFDYRAQAQGRFEVPVGERMAVHRARRADERVRTKARGRSAAPPRGRRSGTRRSRPVR